MDGAGGKWVQADRGGRPGQAVFLTGEEIGAYCAGEPADDARFVAVFAHSLEHAGGYTPEEATRVAKTLLPDILMFEPARPASFGESGRPLTDDAADAFVRILTNGRLKGDGVGPHHDLLVEFPYLGPPHNARRWWTAPESYGWAREKREPGRVGMPPARHWGHSSGS